MSSLIYLMPVLPLCWLFRRLISNRHLYFFFVLGATATHELSHFIVGLLLNAKPIGFSLIPRRTSETEWTLGSVNFQNIRWFNGLPIGMAPLLLLVPFYVRLPKDFTLSDFRYTTGADLFFWLVLAYILPAAIPSKTDLKVGFGSAAPALILAAIAGAAYLYSR